MDNEEFELETNTVWSFPKRGKWATHDAKYRGNFSPYVAKNIILRYSQPKDVVLDQFVGGGTTLIECKLNNRNAIGVDINPAAVNLTQTKLDFKCECNPNIEVKLGDACNLKEIKNDSVDLICTHPPYADIIKYSDGINGDLSQLKYKDFVVAMEQVAKECYRVLKKDKYCAIVMGDTRKNGMVQPLGFEVMQKFIQAGFKQKEIIIKDNTTARPLAFGKPTVKNTISYCWHMNIFLFSRNDRLAQGFMVKAESVWRWGRRRL